MLLHCQPELWRMNGCCGFRKQSGLLVSSVTKIVVLALQMLWVVALPA